jgi:glycosyltransferase involved in cell wall biosynthesis
MIKVSVVIPTLNSANVLESCLQSIKSQKCPNTKVELIVADGGSTDDTLKIAKNYKAIITKNPLKTAEAGKACGLKKVTGDFVALIDSDNILPNKLWLKTMISPLLNDPELIGSEPWKFTYRKSAGFMERYSALTGVNDPYALVSGVYDRKNYLTPSWTGLDLETINYSKYLKITLKPGSLIPTIGANGTIFRSNFLKKNINSDYLFDIDLISEVIKKTQKPVYFAKVKIGIIHTFCESSLQKFVRKQSRRITDYLVYKKLRHYDWDNVNNDKTIYFILYVITIIPMFYHLIKGFIRKPDLVWLLHPIICIITLYIYAINFAKYRLNLLKPVNRTVWQQ